MKETTGVNTTQVLAGMGLGALLMYLLDPEQGPQRRTMARDSMVRWRDSGREMIDAGAAELGNQASRAIDTLKYGADRLRHQGMGLAEHGLHMASRTTTMHRSSTPTWLIAAAGVGLAALVFGNRRVRNKVSSMAGSGQPIEVERSVQISASPEQVFELWSNYENFPRFMSRVEEVRPLGGDRSHWVVKGPAGSRLEWDSVLTEREQGRLLAWRSEPDAQVYNTGRVMFQPSPTGTLVTVRISYTPPAGAIGHAVASLFNRNPGQDLDADLQRMKSFIESGGRASGGIGAQSSGVGTQSMRH